MNKQQIPPIVKDYWRKTAAAQRTKSAETRRRLNWEASQLLGVMTAKAAQMAVEGKK